MFKSFNNMTVITRIAKAEFRTTLFPSPGLTFSILSAAWLFSAQRHPLRRKRIFPCFRFPSRPHYSAINSIYVGFQRVEILLDRAVWWDWECQVVERDGFKKKPRTSIVIQMFINLFFVVVSQGSSSNRLKLIKFHFKYMQFLVNQSHFHKAAKKKLI